MSASFKRELLVLINKIKEDGLEDTMGRDTFIESVVKITKEYECGLLCTDELALGLVELNLKVQNCAVQKKK